MSGGSQRDRLACALLKQEATVRAQNEVRIRVLCFFAKLEREYCFNWLQLQCSNKNCSNKCKEEMSRAHYSWSDTPLAKAWQGFSKILLCGFAIVLGVCSSKKCFLGNWKGLTTKHHECRNNVRRKMLESCDAWSEHLIISEWVFMIRHECINDAWCMMHKELLMVPHEISCCFMSTHAIPWILIITHHEWSWWCISSQASSSCLLRFRFGFASVLLKAARNKACKWQVKVPWFGI